MKKYLYIKFVLAFFILGFIGFFTVSLAGSSMAEQHVESVYSNQLYREATDIASNRATKYYRETSSPENTYQNLCTVASYQECSIWLISPQGEILMNTADEMYKEDYPVIEDFDPGTASGSYYQIGNFFNEFSQEQLSVMVPVTLNMNIEGYVAIHLPMSVIYEQRDNILNILYIASAMLFALSLIILLVFTQTVYLPLRKINEGANEYAAGNLDYRIHVPTHDEMGYLAATLNYMSDELNKMEEYQKNFIANVSHDFRSPLTSIKGYLEAILDGTIPPEMYEKYLSRVISETERLHKLTESMLTLNSLDAKGYLSRSNFDINRVIKDTAASFEGTCAAKDIRFDLTFSDAVQMVYADMGKIQQVMYNLIDNAIKFSHSDSIIYIQASERYEKVFISVKDTGIGIPKDSIKKIWERFYKTDLSRGKDKRGTGLGLSIVKEIIQAHGENIDVVSTEGVGTEFIFSLPKSSSL